MRISIEMGDLPQLERTVELKIKASELAEIHLHIAFPGERNRTDRFMRRHALAGDSACPNTPFRSEKEPPKLSIPDHLAEMKRMSMIPNVSPPHAKDKDGFRMEPVMFAVPISDLAANLLRPAFHVSGLGEHRVFFFGRRAYPNQNLPMRLFFYPWKH